MDELKPFRVLGVDLGSNQAGFAIVGDYGDIVGFGEWTALKARPLNERLRDFWRCLGSRLYEEDDSFEGSIFVAVETPWIPREAFRQAAPVLYQQLGLVRSVVWAYAQRKPTGVATHILEVTPAEGKRALTGSGRASKRDMVAAAQAQFGYEFSEHEADAIGVALAGLQRAKERRLRQED